MGRKRQPDARRDMVGARVSEQTLAALDKARGAMSRSEAVAAAIDAWVAAQPWHKSYPARTPVGIDIVVDDRVPPGVALLEPVPEPRKRRVVRRCTHPGTRSLGGWCDSCNVLVKPGGYLP